jgi:hypothetical protein
VLNPLGLGAAHAGDAGAADLRGAAVVFVIGDDVADRSMQPDRVVLCLDAGELCGEPAASVRLITCGQSPLELGSHCTMLRAGCRLWCWWLLVIIR